MKELHILRHAKSSWVNSNLTDYDRPLSKKGINDAINLSIYIERNNISVDRILCSSAERTKQTCDLVYRSTRVNQKEILYTDKLYYQNRETIKNLIKTQDDKINKIMIIGHNPYLHYFIQDYSEKDILKFPTCSLAILRFEGDWRKFINLNINLALFLTPKEIT